MVTTRYNSRLDLTILEIDPTELLPKLCKMGIEVESSGCPSDNLEGNRLIDSGGSYLGWVFNGTAVIKGSDYLEKVYE